MATTIAPVGKPPEGAAEPREAVETSTMAARGEVWRAKTLPQTFCRVLPFASPARIMFLRRISRATTTDASGVYAGVMEDAHARDVRDVRIDARRDSHACHYPPNDSHHGSPLSHRRRVQAVRLTDRSIAYLRRFNAD